MVLLLQVCENPFTISQLLTKLYYKLSNLSKLRLNQTSFLLNQSNSNIIDMAVPQGAFAACKLREQFHERDLIVSRLRTSNNTEKADNNNAQREYLPVKYNDKLMNSIWGLYNRYSPHNVKKNEFVPPKF